MRSLGTPELTCLLDNKEPMTVLEEYQGSTEPSDGRSQTC